MVPCMSHFTSPLMGLLGDCRRVEVFLSEFSSLEVGAAHRPLPLHFVQQLRRWQSEPEVPATSATTLYGDHQPHPDDEAPPNSLAKVVCIWEGPNDPAARVRKHSVSSTVVSLIHLHCLFTVDIIDCPFPVHYSD